MRGFAHLSDKSDLAHTKIDAHWAHAIEVCAAHHRRLANPRPGHRVPRSPIPIQSTSNRHLFRKVKSTLIALGLRMQTALIAMAFGIWTLFVHLLTAYFGKKGENLATREDIGEITRKIENAKLETQQRFEELAQANRAVLQRQGQRHELSMAAIDKRLAVHQEAFARCFQLYFQAHEEASADLAEQSLQWWRENCLYLSANSNTTFVRACVAAGMHRGLIDKVPQEALEDNWSRIDGSWETIAAEVDLPQIGAGARTADLDAKGRHPAS